MVKVPAKTPEVKQQKEADALPVGTLGMRMLGSTSAAAAAASKTLQQAPKLVAKPWVLKLKATALPAQPVVDPKYKLTVPQKQQQQERRALALRLQLEEEHQRESGYAKLVASRMAAAAGAPEEVTSPCTCSYCRAQNASLVAKTSPSTAPKPDSSAQRKAVQQAQVQQQEEQRSRRREARRRNRRAKAARNQAAELAHQQQLEDLQRQLDELKKLTSTALQKPQQPAAAAQDAAAPTEAAPVAAGSKRSLEKEVAPAAAATSPARSSALYEHELAQLTVGFGGLKAGGERPFKRQATQKEPQMPACTMGASPAAATAPSALQQAFLAAAGVTPKAPVQEAQPEPAATVTTTAVATEPLSASVPEAEPAAQVTTVTATAGAATEPLPAVPEPTAATAAVSTEPLPAALPEQTAPLQGAPSTEATVMGELSLPKPAAVAVAPTVAAAPDAAGTDATASAPKATGSATAAATGAEDLPLAAAVAGTAADAGAAKVASVVTAVPTKMRMPLSSDAGNNGAEGQAALLTVTSEPQAVGATAVAGGAIDKPAASVAVGEASLATKVAAAVVATVPAGSGEGAQEVTGSGATGAAATAVAAEVPFEAEAAELTAVLEKLSTIDAANNGAQV